MEPLQPLQTLPQRAKKIDIKKELFKYIRVWYWFVLSLIFFIITWEISYISSFLDIKGN